MRPVLWRCTRLWTVVRSCVSPSPEPALEDEGRTTKSFDWRSEMRICPLLSRRARKKRRKKGKETNLCEDAPAQVARELAAAQLELGEVVGHLGESDQLGLDL